MPWEGVVEQCCKEQQVARSIEGRGLHTRTCHPGTVSSLCCNVRVKSFAMFIADFAIIGWKTPGGNATNLFSVTC